MGFNLGFKGLKNIFLVVKENLNIYQFTIFTTLYVTSCYVVDWAEAVLCFRCLSWLAVIMDCIFCEPIPPLTTRWPSRIQHVFPNNHPFSPLHSFWCYLKFRWVMFKKWSLFHQQIVYKNACHPDVAALLFSNESE